MESFTSLTVTEPLSRSQGGRVAAGPYGHRLPHIDLERSHEFERQIADGCEGIKPGWVRVNFNYFLDVGSSTPDRGRADAARDGWRLLGDYTFDPATGLWRHRSGPVEPPMRLREVSYDESGAMTYPHHEDTADVTELARYLSEARRILVAAEPPDCSHREHRTEDFDRPAVVRAARGQPQPLSRTRAQAPKPMAWVTAPTT